MSLIRPVSADKSRVRIAHIFHAKNTDYTPTGRRSIRRRLPRALCMESIREEKGRRNGEVAEGRRHEGHCKERNQREECNLSAQTNNPHNFHCTSPPPSLARQGLFISLPARPPASPSLSLCLFLSFSQAPENNPVVSSAFVLDR